jgi:DNA polymerase-3 subunit gamma/tau
MDVLELDAASRTGVDNIRELQEVISYAPTRDRYKILIIDEAHMLSKAAFNALLKTLEEPPPNVVFVLATTELQKVTILSRCQVFEFRRVAVRELADHLRRVCDTEEIQISDEALERIARAGEGSVRDSLSVLERVLAFCGQQVADEDLLRMLGGVKLEVLDSLLQGLAARDAGVMLQVLDGLVDEGHDLLHFWSELIGALRDLMLMRAVPERTELLARSTEEAKVLAAAVEALSDDDLSRAFQIVADLENGLKASAQPRFLFEAVLIRLASLGAVRPIEEILGELEADGAGSSASRPRGPQKKNRAADPAPKATASSPPAPEPITGSDTDRLIRAVAADNTLLGVILEDASSVHLEDGVLEVLFAAEKQAMVRQLERKELRDQLAGKAAEIAGRPVRVQIDSDASAGAESRSDRLPAAPSSEAHTPDRPAGGPSTRGGERRESASSSPSPPPQRRGRGELLEQAKKDPGVNRLLREFGAQVVDIRPLAASKTPSLHENEPDSIDPAEETP